MDEFRALLLEVWREACRHTDIATSTATIADLVSTRLPIDHIGVLAIDWNRARVQQRAGGLGDGGRPAALDRNLSDAEKALLLSWARSSRVLHRSAAAASASSASDTHIHELLLPSHSDASWMIGALRSDDGPTGVVVLRAKPDADFDVTHERMLEALLEPLSAALENDRRLHELAALREAAEADKRSALARLGRDDLRDTIIGADAGLRQVMERVNLVARLDVPVLLLGETGTGKEVIARTIHEASSRSRGPFIRVNCGAIPPELIDSELFGHEKGAFTGATSSRRGWFERADNGTLLLDEVGELPLPAQVRLLRVLQEGSFERVGGERSVNVDVRIVASTHRDLPAMIQNGEFRQDLWYRIAGFPIVLPPLRERREDTPALAAHFAARAARHFGLRPTRLAAEDVELLTEYDWPGNVRELISVIDRAAILGEGERLELAAALGSPDPRLHRRGTSAPAAPDASRGSAALDEAMRKHIESMLRSCRGRIEGHGGTAERLGINPHTLRARMRKLGIDWRKFRGAASGD
ncbi:MAG TPA: sigma-54 dependent transcriptional regulator [Candidatus Limnocylindrales bacterium]|nr:sigma-54 dependent transcriptional regulator [Candidatus Limnocylindrales bacterium]